MLPDIPIMPDFVCPWIPWILLISLDYPWIAEFLFRVSVDSVDTASTSVDRSQIPHFLTPCQSIRGFPRILRTSVDDPTDATLPNHPLSEYPWIPWILRTSVDHPRMPHFLTTFCQSIRGFRGYCDIYFSTSDRVIVFPN